jgi:hypothetical protein
MNSPPAPELRGAHPRWGPRRLAYELAKAAVAPVPSLSTIYRVLVRHGMVEDGELLATVPRHSREISRFKAYGKRHAVNCPAGGK